MLANYNESRRALRMLAHESCCVRLGTHLDAIKRRSAGLSARAGAAAIEEGNCACFGRAAAKERTGD
jgi:hypothetical protein